MAKKVKPLIAELLIKNQISGQAFGELVDELKGVDNSWLSYLRDWLSGEVITDEIALYAYNNLPGFNLIETLQRFIKAHNEAQEKKLLIKDIKKEALKYALSNSEKSFEEFLDQSES